MELEVERYLPVLDRSGGGCLRGGVCICAFGEFGVNVDEGVSVTLSCV